MTHLFSIKRSFCLFACALLCCTGSFANAQSISNGTFESGLSSWTSSGSFYAWTNVNRAHRGSRYGYFGAGADGSTALVNGSGSIRQNISVPTGTTSALLTYWVSVNSDDSPSIEYDRLYVDVLNSSGGLQQTIFTNSNLHKTAGYSSTNVTYQYRAHSLNAFAGQTIGIRFRGTNDSSAGTLFRLDDVNVTVLTVTAPNGGETWTAGTSQKIGWSIAGNTENISYYKIVLSTDSGSTFPTDLTPSGVYTPASREWDWAIESTLNTTQARIRIRALDVDSYILSQDTNDSNFAIAPPQVTATIFDATWSNGVDVDGDGYKRTARLNWDPDVVGSTGSLNVFEKIYYKPASSSTWTLLTTTSTHTITGSVSSDSQFLDVGQLSRNSYDWKIEIFRSGESSLDYTRDSGNDADLNDYNMELVSEDARLTITSPNGGEIWAAGSTHTITWDVSGTTSDIWYYKIALSTDGGLTWPDAGTANDLTPNGVIPSARSFAWTISSSLQTTQARIRIRGIDFNGYIIPTVNDTNDAAFTITSAAPDIRVDPTQLTFTCGTAQSPARGSSAISVNESFGSVGGTETMSRNLKPRPIAIKPKRSVVDHQFHQDVIVVQFREGQKIRARNGQIVDLGTGALASAKNVLSQFSKGRWERLDSIPEERIDELRQHAQRNLGREIADLNLQFNLFLPETVTAADAIDALNALDIVEYAQAIPRAATPSVPDYQQDQEYLSSPTSGVNAVNAWNVYSTRGAGIKIADIEYGYNANHADLPVVTNVGATPGGPENHHGTAVLSVLAAKNDSKGVVGLASDATLYFSAATTVASIPAAVTAAADALGEGDIILFELSISGPRSTEPLPSQKGYLPVEWYKPVYDRILLAVGKNITVVEPAGNGSENLDDAIYDDPIYNLGFNPFRVENDSGAIMIGAGTSHGGRERKAFSNYGATLDLHAWGENVWAAGYGSALGSPYYDSEGANVYYTGRFDGTSSASPIVAGACALLQSAYKSETGNVLSPRDVRHILRSSGSPQQGNTSQNIGPLPNVNAAISSILPAQPGTSFRIYNDGPAPLSVTALDLDQTTSWITLSPLELPCVIPAQAFRTVTVFVNCSEAPVGQTTRTLAVASNDPDENPGISIQVSRESPPVDTTNPTVSISTPTANQNFNTASISATGTASDPGSPSSGVSLVEVRVNSGSWNTATGTTSWSASVSLSAGDNLIEARSRDVTGNYSTIASVNATYTVPNTAPNTPANVSPGSNAINQPTSPVLQSSTFSDADSDNHAASQWIIRSVNANSVAFDSGEDASNKTFLMTTAGLLQHGTLYDWKVRYKDNRGAWSQYSTATTFTTLAPSLGSMHQSTNLVFYWPTNTTGYVLEFATNLPPGTWTPVSGQVFLTSGQNVLTNPITGNVRFFRLKRP